MMTGLSGVGVTMGHGEQGEGDGCAALGMSLPLAAPFPCLHDGDRARTRGAFFTASAEYYRLLVGLRAKRGLTGAWEMEAERDLAGAGNKLVTGDEPVWPERQDAAVTLPQLGGSKETAGEQGRGISASQSAGCQCGVSHAET